MDGLRRFWFGFKVGAWLGWQIESNWTDPFLFAVYSVIKPLAAAAILVVMYAVVSRNAFEHPLFTYIYLGNAFYMYVGGVLQGVSWAVVEDREHYRTLRYVYITPVSFMAYLLGRGLARFVITTIAVLVLLASGVLFLHLRLDWAAVNWPLFLAGLFLGVTMLAFMGLMLAGVLMLTVHHSWFVGEAVGGALFLFSGAIFPLEVLPQWLRPVGYALPITYWLELLRRTLVGSTARAFPTFAHLETPELFALLAAMTAGVMLLGGVVFTACERYARRAGLVDRVTNY